MPGLAEESKFQSGTASLLFSREIETALHREVELVQMGILQPHVLVLPA